MKKLVVLTIVIIVAVAIGIIYISGRGDSSEDRTLKVGLVVTGKCDDKNFCQTFYEALKAVDEKIDIDIICKESVPEDEKAYETFEELVEHDHCEMIVGASFGYGEYIKKSAAKHPDVYYIHPTGSAYEKNLTSIMGRMYQVKYLSGIVAGMRTKTNELGYVAAFPIPEVIRGIDAFALGAKSVNPDVEVYVRYCNSWTDDDPAREASVRLLDEHNIDVITMHTNSMAPNDEAEKRGVWSIGHNKDNAGDFPNTYLTACVWQWDDFLYEQVQNCLQNESFGMHAWFGIEDGAMSLSRLTDNVAPRTKEKVDAAKDKLLERTFDVFYGPIVDNKGTLRVAEGECLSDEELLERLDWYVGGVHVEE